MSINIYIFIFLSTPPWASVKLFASQLPAMEAKPMATEHIARLIQNMLAPKKGERMLFLTDYGSRPSESRFSRAELLARWHAAASLLAAHTGFRVLPIV